MTSRKGLLLGLVLLCAAVFGASVAKADDVQIVVRSDSGSTVHLKFFSKDYNRVWPGASRVWVLDDYSPHTYSLACTSGENVCFGAWIPGDTSYWGVGRNGRKGCSSCCFVCGSGPYKTQVLQDADGDDDD